MPKIKIFRNSYKDSFLENDVNNFINQKSTEYRSGVEVLKMEFIPTSDKGHIACIITYEDIPPIRKSTPIRAKSVV